MDKYNLSNQKEIEEAGLNYDRIIFKEDILPSRIYNYQINKRNDRIDRLVDNVTIVLDVGCGTGFHTQELMKKAEKVISTDVSFNAVKNAKKKINNKKVEFLVCDASTIPLIDDSVDMTLISGVLHHIPEKITKSLANISKITKNQILIDEPNKILLWYIIMRLSKADPVGNETPLDADKIIEELKKNGFSKISLSYWGFLVQIALGIRLNFLAKFLEQLEKNLEKYLGRRFYFRWTINAKRLKNGN